MLSNKSFDEMINAVEVPNFVTLTNDSGCYQLVYNGKYCQFTNYEELQFLIYQAENEYCSLINDLQRRYKLTVGHKANSVFEISKDHHCEKRWLFIVKLKTITNFEDIHHLKAQLEKPIIDPL